MAQSGIYEREGIDWSSDGEWWDGRKWKKLGNAGREDSNSGIFQQQGFHGNNSANLEGAWGVEINENEKHWAQVEEGGSWCIDRSRLVVLTSMNIEENSGEVDLNHCLFWIRVYDLLVGFKTKEMAERIGKSMENFIKWEWKCYGKIFQNKSKSGYHSATKEGN